MKNSFRKSVAVLAAATALTLFAGVTQAQAATRSGAGWKVTYSSATKKLKVTDTRKDGMSVQISIHDTVTDKFKYCHVGGYKKSKTCQLNFKKGHKLSGYAALLSNGVSYDDGDVFKLTA